MSKRSDRLTGMGCGHSKASLSSLHTAFAAFQGGATGTTAVREQLAAVKKVRGMFITMHTIDFFQFSEASHNAPSLDHRVLV